MRDRRVTAAALLLGLALAAGACARAAPPAPPSGTAPPAAEPAAGTVTWRAVTDEQLPAAVRDWIRRHEDEVGIFQRREGDATYVAVTWGERRTGGYAVEVEDVRAAGDGVLLLAVRLQVPPAGEPATQALTHPRAVIAVRPAADYRLAPVFLGSHFLQNAAFELMEPMPYTAVADAVRVRGRARVFEASFLVRVEDARGTLVEQPVMAREGAPAWGEFDARLPFPRAPEGGEGRVVVYEASAKDGAPIHVLSIPVRLGR